MNRKNGNERNALLDIAKFLFSILIVIVHTVMVENTSGAFFWRILVGCFNPVGVFMMISAFYLYKSAYNPDDKKFNLVKVRRTCWRLFRIYLLWQILYFPWIIKGNTIPGNARASLVNLVVKTLILGDNAQFWYIYATVLAMITITWSYNKLGLKCTVVVCVFMHIFSLAGDSWHSLISLGWFGRIIDIYLEIGKMDLFRGFANIGIGFLVGALWAHKQDVIKNRKISIIVMWGMFSAFQMIELSLLKQYGLGLSYSNALLKPLVSGAVFCLLLSINAGNNIVLSNFLGKASTVIYFSHMLFVDLMVTLHIQVGAWIKWTICVLARIVLTWLLSAISKKIHYIRYFY